MHNNQIRCNRKLCVAIFGIGLLSLVVGVIVVVIQENAGISDAVEGIETEGVPGSGAVSVLTHPCVWTAGVIGLVVYFWRKIKG